MVVLMAPPGRHRKLYGCRGGEHPLSEEFSKKVSKGSDA